MLRFDFAELGSYKFISESLSPGICSSFGNLIPLGKELASAPLRPRESLRRSKLCGTAREKDASVD